MEATSEELEEVRQALRDLPLSDKAVQAFKPKHLALLSEELYTTVDALQAATRKSLLEIKLPRALVDYLKPEKEPQQVSLRDNEDFKRMQAAVANLELHQYTSTRTSRTDADIGKYWRGEAYKTEDIPFLAHVSRITVEAVAKAVLEKFPNRVETGQVYVPVKKNDEEEPGPSDSGNKKRKVPDPPSPNFTKLPGCTLADCIPAARRAKFKEDAHMQPAVITMLETAVEVLRSKLIVRDTHSSSHQFIHPIGRPDASLLAAALVAWTQLVSVGEFKVGEATDDLDSMFGQLISRAMAILDSQPNRQRVVSFGLTMNSIEFVHVERAQDKSWSVLTTGTLPFSVSADSAGFWMWVRLLATDLSDFGFIKAETPDLRSLQGVQISSLALLRRGGGDEGPFQGTVPNSVGSVVFAAATPGQNQCILKLCHSSFEGDVLSHLEQEGVSHVVQLLARGTCTYNNRAWHALLLVPYAVRLTRELPVRTLAQVALDIAVAIDESLQAGVAHRDVTLDNIGIVNGRGVLYDYSAAKFIDPEESDTIAPASPSGKLDAITATSLYAALSVLEGQSHTRSSMLEGLYISILAASCDERLTGRHEMKIADLGKCQINRRGCMLALRPPDFSKVPSTHLGFIKELHQLFYPFQDGLFARLYNVEVELNDFKAVCEKWIGD